jgi:hypothetical protein
VRFRGFRTSDNIAIERIMFRLTRTSHSAASHWTSQNRAVAILLATVLFGAAAAGQEVAPAGARIQTGAQSEHSHVVSAPAAHLPGHTDAADETAVISVTYDCPGAKAVAEGRGVCSAAVSRREFDLLVRALDPNMPASSRQALAAEYARLVIMAAEARRRGFEHSQEFQTLLNFSALQLLSTRLVKEITSRSSDVSNEDVEVYFRTHRREFDEVLVSRIQLPGVPDHNTESRSQSAARAEAVRNRARKGEDPVILQREISGSSSTASAVSTGPYSCASLPEAHRSVCGMNPGEVSDVLPDGRGYAVYRLESRRERETGEVREQIRTMLQRQRVQKELEAVRRPLSLDLNEAYFGKLPRPDVAHAHGMHFPASSNAPAAASKDAHQH